MSSESDYLVTQRKDVHFLLLKEGVFNANIINQEIDFFYEQLGLPLHYFLHSSPEIIAKHIVSFQAAKLLAQTSGHKFDIRLRLEGEDSALFGARSFVSAKEEGKQYRVETDSADPLSPIVRVERHIEAVYLSGGSHDAEDSQTSVRHMVPAESLSFKAAAHPARDQVYRLQAFRSRGMLDTESGVHLRLYFLKAPVYANPAPAEGETRLSELADVNFLKSADQATLDIHQSVMERAVKSLGPVIELAPDFYQSSEGPETLLLIAHRTGMTHSYFTGVPDVYRFWNVYATRKYVESFSNGMVMFSFFLRSLDGVKKADGSVSVPTEDFKTRLAHIVHDASHHFVLPRTSLTPLLHKGTLSAQHVAYAYAGWKFAFHFLSRSTDDIARLASAVGQAHPELMSVISRLKSSMKSHAFTEGSILDTLYQNTDIIEWLYSDFTKRHMPSAMNRTRIRQRTFSEASHSLAGVASIEEGMAFLRRKCKTEMDLACFSSFFTFNLQILKTNFFMRVKTALSFRLDPSFLPEADYPDRPMGLFFVVGSEFRGFHIRFHDVARGGIRLVRSAYTQAFAQNVASSFDECYNLAHTQQRKNKDIPEGGSKGIILLNLAHQHKGRVAFEKFVDSLLDLLLPNDQIVDHYGKQELLFLGPDEGTADYMDWASAHARKRKYPYWKAFTTGKSLSLGGIPHDKYGMTTHSVRAYVKGIQAKLGLNSANTIKFQTGGPDGDLGSNEILLGTEVTVAIVDGSGVLHDPKGINHDELVRLAKARITVKNFNTDLLSDQGSLVLIEDKDKKLPDGTVIESGLNYRNFFHLSNRVRGDFFVPCGGRPASVTASNVDDFLYGADAKAGKHDRTPRFRFVIEGANLFFTQDARLVMEKAGLVVFKDASANKGGVTSSSLEVLSALCLSDDEFDKMMAVSDPDNPPEFYVAYVREVQDVIDHNADLEFDCIWREHERLGTSRSELSDSLSRKITNLSDSIEESDALYNMIDLRNKVLQRAIPRVLQKAIGYDTIVKRLPEPYARALFASHLASRFIYAHGLDTPEYAFFQHVQDLLAGAPASPTNVEGQERPAAGAETGDK